MHRRLKTLFNISIFFVVVCSCQLTGVNRRPSSIDEVPEPEPIGLIELGCDKLIEKANDSLFSLKSLAGIRAHKNCKGYRIDLKQLTDLEKRLFADEISDLDPAKPPPSKSLNIKDLKKNLKTAENPTEKMKAYKALRGKLKNSGQRNDYLKITAEMFNWTKRELKKNKKNVEAISFFYEASQILSRTYWTENQHSQARKILTDSLRQLKGLTSVAEIYFIQARMSEEDEEYDEAVANYDLALEDIGRNSPKTISFTADKVNWLKSWILYKNKKWTEAEAAFAKYASTTLDLGEKSRALFYQARCLKKLEKPEESKKILESITADDFFNYYGLVSYYELGKKFPAVSKISSPKKFTVDLEFTFLSPTEKNIFVDLIKYKEYDIAEKAIPILAKVPEKQINFALYMAEKVQRYLPLFASFAKLPNEAKIDVFLTYPQLIFPQPYTETVRKMSDITSIPPSLIYAIMKQESAFNERTRSHADAMGLMQAIPKLAKQLAKKFNVEYKKPADLYNPEINIQIGTYELQQQVKKQDGQLSYVAAAYNAGPNALEGWLKKKNKADDLLEFIEEIPYEETRTYVKLIARNKLFYDRISKRDEEVEFPGEFLRPVVAKQDMTALIQPSN